MKLTDFPRNPGRLSFDIEEERQSQNRKWGIQTHELSDWMLILGEEYGEACKEANEAIFRTSELSKVRKELIQTIAVAVAIIEGIDSRA
jgi:hypothetical protein